MDDFQRRKMLDGSIRADREGYLAQIAELKIENEKLRETITEARLALDNARALWGKANCILHASLEKDRTDLDRERALEGDQ